MLACWGLFGGDILSWALSDIKTASSRSYSHYAHGPGDFSSEGGQSLLQRQSFLFDVGRRLPQLRFWGAILGGWGAMLFIHTNGHRV